MNYEQNKPVEALGYSRRALKLLRTRFDRSTTRQEEGVKSEQRAAKATFYAHADFALSDGHTEPRVGFGEAFEALQRQVFSGRAMRSAGCRRVRPQAVQAT